MQKFNPKFPRTLIKNKQNFGHCYNINSGDSLAVILSRGKAANEMLSVVTSRIVGDSIQITGGVEKVIKTFSINDILTNKREFSTVKVQDTLHGIVPFKLNNGALLCSFWNMNADQNHRYLITDNKSDIFKSLLFFFMTVRQYSQPCLYCNFIMINQSH